MNKSKILPYFAVAGLAAGIGFIAGSKKVNQADPSLRKTSLAEAAPENQQPPTSCSAGAFISNKGQINSAPVNNEAIESEVTESILQTSLASVPSSEIVNTLNQLTTEQLSADAGRLLIRRWAEYDPRAAATWIDQLSDVFAKHELSAVVAVLWAEQNFSESLAWVHSLPDGDTKNNAMTQLGFETARTSPIDSLHIAFEIPASNSRDDLLIHGLKQWAIEDAEGASEWVKSIPAGPLRERALADVATVISDQDGLAGANLATLNIPPGPQLERAVIGIVQRWCQNEPDATSAWVAQFSDSPLQQNALNQIALINNHRASNP